MLLLRIKGFIWFKFEKEYMFINKFYQMFFTCNSPEYPYINMFFNIPFFKVWPARGFQYHCILLIANLIPLQFIKVYSSLLNTTCLARKDEGVDDRLPLFHPNDVLVTKLLIVYRRKVIRKACMVRSYRILHEKDFTT